MLEAEDLAALGVDSRHDVLNRAVFSRRIHGLENLQYRVAVGGIEQLLLRTERLDMFAEQVLILLIRLVHGIDERRPFAEVDFVSFPHPKIAGLDDHSIPCWPTRLL